MNFITRFLSCGAIIGLLNLLGGCGGNPGPSPQGLLNHLNGALSLSQPYELSGIQPVFYPQTDGSLVIKGRVHGKLKEDLFENASINDHLRDLGFDAQAWDNARTAAQALREPYRSTLLGQIPDDIRNNQLPYLIKVATHAGLDVPFDFSIVAQRSDKGWVFGQDMLNPTDMPRGQVRSTFGNDVFVVDSDAEKAATHRYIAFCQNFVKLVADAQKSIAAEEDKIRQQYLAVTAVGKTYLGNFTTTGGAWVTGGNWPLGLTFTEQQILGTGIVIKGLIYDPADPTHKRSFEGRLELNRDQNRGEPIRFNATSAIGTLARPKPGNMTEVSLCLNVAFSLSIDEHGHLSGTLSSQWGHLINAMQCPVNFVPQK